jgi:cobalt-zinc-cadmium efflux system membrane fusion protein
VGRDNLETELFVIADLDRVWIAVSPADLPLVREGQGVVITVRAAKDKADGKIVFISPLLDKETRSARVVAEIENGGGMWRPGSFVTAAIAVDEQAARLVVPSSAVQRGGSDRVSSTGRRVRPVVVGRNAAAPRRSSPVRRPATVTATGADPARAEMLKASSRTEPMHVPHS